MKRFMFLGALLGLMTFARAEQVLKEITFDKAPEHCELVPATQPAKGAATQPAAVLKVNGDGEQDVIQILVLDKPGVKSDHYAITGMVRYDAVEGDGYLEMWNYFADGGYYFTRTLGASGPMGKLKGTRKWRAFILPFNSSPDQFPTKLVVNVVLPGKGTVYLKDMKLVQYAPTSKPAAKAGIGAWWSPRDGGIIGAIAGIVLGTMGALQGMLVSRGKAKRTMIALTVIVLIAGIGTAALGLVAVGHAQPYHVYYPLLLAGGLGALLPAVMLPVLRRRYEQMELRRISAMDAG